MPDIRPFRPADLDALYAISLATGHEGGDASHLYADGRLIGHIYSAPYAILEPRFALVVEDDEGVGGFAIGVSDTTEWHDRLEREWWPTLRRTYIDPSAIPADQRSADQRRAFTIHHPERPPREVVDRYPGHVHLNLSPRLQGRGIGTVLFSEWVAGAARQGIAAIHVGINRANGRALKFWPKHGFAEVPVSSGGSRRTVWMGRP